MKYISKLLAFFSLCSSLLLTSTAPVHAEPYLGQEFGWAETKALNDWDLSVYSRSFMYRIFGGYLWGKPGSLRYGVEAGVGFLAPVKREFESFRLEYRAFQMDALGVAEFYFTKNWDIFAKGGAAYSRQNLSIHARHYSDSVHYDQVTPKAVYGIGYNLHKDINMSFACEHNFREGGLERRLTFGLRYLLN